MYGSDFDIEDRVNATEGESIIPANAFGAYGDEHDEFGDEADFGNLGFGSLEMGSGETDTFNTMTIGDFSDSDLGEDDDETMGFSRRWKRRFKRRFKRRIKSRAGRSVIRPAKLAVPFRGFVKPMLNRQRGFLKRGVHQFAQKHKQRIQAVQHRAMVAGRPIPKVMDFIPPQQRQAMIKSATAKAIKLTQAQQLNKAGTPKLSPASIMSPPRNDGAVVVARAGAPLTQATVSSTMLSPAAAVSSAAQSKYSHPLLAVMNPMGDYGDDGQMGFDFKSFLSKAKADASAALKKAQADALAKLKQRGSNLLSQTSSRLINDPKVQAVVKEEAKQSAAASVAQKLLDPSVQKKAAIGTGAVLALVAAGAYFMAKRN